MNVEKRRRRENKTDYKARLNLLKSETARIVFRKTNRYVIGQYVKSREAQDSVVIGVNSKQLLKFGWPETAKGSLKSLTASYLAGFLLGRKIIDREDKVEAIFDTGLIENSRKAYAFLKGVVDAGINVKHGENIFPDEKKIKTEKVDFDKIKEKIEND